MMTKEKIAHDLAIVYLCNRYGIDVTGDFSVFTHNDSNTTGSGNVETARFPDVHTPKKIKEGTGVKGFLGFEKKKWVESGYLVDSIFANMIDDYYKAFSRFLKLLEEKEHNEE